MPAPCLPYLADTIYAVTLFSLVYFIQQHRRYKHASFERITVVSSPYIGGSIAIAQVLGMVSVRLSDLTYCGDAGLCSYCCRVHSLFEAAQLETQPDHHSKRGSTQR